MLSRCYCTPDIPSYLVSNLDHILILRVFFHLTDVFLTIVIFIMAARQFVSVAGIC